MILSANQMAAMKRARGSGAAARREAAGALAVAALGFLAAEPEQLSRFLASSGIAPDAIRDAARQAGFLAGVLDHFAADERLLLAFARQQQIDPAEIERARAALGAVWERDLP
jgi:hypothetical protein